MYAAVVCGFCGGLNVVDLEVEFRMGETAALSDVTVLETTTFNDFFERYRDFVYDLSEFPVARDKLIERIKRFFNCSTSLAYEILDRLKLDLGLYEKDGMIYSVD